MQAIDSGPLILTTREAIARSLRREHALARKHSGQTAWEVPQIHGLQRWCREQWLQTWPTAQLLHGVQELALWQRAIEEDGAAGNVLSKAALAREARATGRLVIQYRIDPARSPQYTDEHEAFLRWYRSVREAQREHDWLAESEIPLSVAELVRQGAITAPRRLVITGATSQMTPLDRHLLEILSSAGCEISIDARPEARAHITASGHPDDEHQFRALAVSLREKLLPCMDGEAPPPRLLVLCPDPEARRDLMESCFKPLLAPWLLLPDGGMRPVPWRFANGRGLDRQPLVAAALAICGLSAYENSLDEVSRVLLASALWTPEQREQTAVADFRLRDAGGTRFTLHALLSCLPTPMQARFIALRDAVHGMPRRALPSAWVAHFEQRLLALGWPGDRTLGSAAFQAREHWMLALNSFSAMDAQSGPVSHAQAVTWLREIVSSSGFEPRADHEQPIQILSLQEGAGMPADEVFLVDATDTVLPGLPRRFPLLAGETLVAAGVPGITAASVLEEAHSLAADILAQAGNLHLSHAGVDERGAECTPTPIFGTEIEWLQDKTEALLSSVERAATGSLLFMPASDPVPPVLDAAAEGITGGVKIFKDFAEAPFFAFCRHRLGIRPLPEPAAGIPATAQGNIIHAVLDSVWGELRTRDALVALPPERLGELLDTPLDRALARELPTDRFGPLLRQIERARLRDIVLQWLEHEKRRIEAFEVVEREQKIEMNFEGLALRLVIDRVDRVHTRLNDERFLIIDYKTGREAETRGWKAGKLQEPQLPLYATGAKLGRLAITHVDGIAFAHLKDGHPAFPAAVNWGLGLIDDKPAFKMESWTAQLDAWRDSLTQIARGFLAGEAGIDDIDKYRYSFNRDLLNLIRENL